MDTANMESPDHLSYLVTGTVNAPLPEEFAIAPEDFPEFVRRRIARLVDGADSDRSAEPIHPAMVSLFTEVPGALQIRFFLAAGIALTDARRFFVERIDGQVPGVNRLCGIGRISRIKKIWDVD